MLVPLRGLRGLGVLAALGTLDDFAQQIKRVEGYYAPGTPGFPNGSLAYQNNNPGNIRYTSYYAKNFGAVPGNGGYSRFPSYAVGYEALKRQITLDANRGLTIRQMMAKYAPAEDGNNPASYAATIAQALGVSVDTLVSSVIGGGSSVAPTPPPPPTATPDGEQEPILAGGLLDATVNIGGVDIPVAGLFLGGMLAFGLFFVLRR